jgi:Uma2 family endonuclease
MSEPKRKPATYEDVLRAPETMVAEIVEGDLYLSPRPSKPHALAASELISELRPPFSRAKGGPGGWVILVEPEVHFGPHVLVPDLAGWLKERAPLEGDEPYFTVPPDWVCEVVSPSTGRLDRIKKLPLYAAHDVRHVWLVDPTQRSLEVYRNEDRRWVLIATHADQEEVRAEPFAEVALELAALWV